MIVVLCLLTSIMVVAILLSPLVIGKGGFLTFTSTIHDELSLNRLKASVLTQFLHEESRASEGKLSQWAWRQRQSFLFHRYVDIVRQIDRVKETGGGR